MSRYVIDLRSRAADDRSIAGGKGAGLNGLARQGFNVPPGFVITALAFKDFVVSLGLGSPDEGATPACRERLFDAALAAPIPLPIRNSILQAYARLGGCVAVRSSAAVEDAGAASHAGQFDTLLDVIGEAALLQAVRACWASLFAARATQYLAHHSEAVSGGMAVVVQRMAPAAVAGVAFSADPMTGQGHIVIEAAPGLGVGVVGGAVRTDRYVADNARALVEVAPAVEGQPVLPEVEVLRLAGIVADIARLANTPQDVEWAWDGAVFHILQARPITTLQGRHVLSRALVSEMAPGLVKPLVYSVNTLATVNRLFGTLFGALLGTRNIDTSRLVARLHSRVYADMTVIGELLAATGLPPNLFEVMLRDETSNRTRMHLSPRLFAITARMILLVLRTGRLTEQQARRLREGRRHLDQFGLRDWSAVPLPDLLTELERVTQLRNGFLWFFFCCVFNSAARTKMLRSWVARNAPDVAFGDLIRGLAGLKSLEPSQELIRLAERARGLDEEARAALFEGDDAFCRRILATSEAGRILLEGVDAFLLRYGYLSSNGSDFSSPSWSENAALIWRSIARGLTCWVEEGQGLSAATIRTAASHRVRASAGPFGRWAFGRLMAGASTAMDWRERASVLVSEYGYQMRRLFLAIAAQLVEHGRLAEIEGVFYLTHQELLDLAAGVLEPADAGARVTQRRDALAADAAVDPPDVLLGIPGQPGAAAVATDRHENALYLSGIGGSPGLVRGFARVVHDPVAAPRTLGRTDILVVPFSDVGWTPLFAGIGGIVAETGGQLSHTAIVAREYNLPAVVGVRDATRRICDGQALTVDGSQGRVYLEPLPA